MSFSVACTVRLTCIMPPWRSFSRTSRSFALLPAMRWRSPWRSGAFFGLDRSSVSSRSASARGVAGPRDLHHRSLLRPANAADRFTDRVVSVPCVDSRGVLPIWRVPLSPDCLGDLRVAGDPRVNRAGGARSRTRTFDDYCELATLLGLCPRHPRFAGGGRRVRRLHRQRHVPGATAAVASQAGRRDRGCRC